MLFPNILICNKQLVRGEIATEKFSEAYCTSLRCYIVQFIFLSLFCHDVAMKMRTLPKFICFTYRVDY